MKRLSFILLGILFGAVMYKTEAASWFRIYEMFSFDSFHMYGIISSALIVGIVGIQCIKRARVKDVYGRDIVIPPKNKSIVRYLVGGILFGLGWALIGACPGPIFVLLGAGVFSMGIVIIFSLLGTYLYGLIRNHLPD